MTREEIRRENARELARQAGGQNDFGRMVSMEGSQVSQIIGKNPIKNIGNSIARRIEIAFSKPEGWLDSPHDEAVQKAPQLAERQPVEAQDGFALSLEKLVLINAINDSEATILRRYRMANETGVRMIEAAATAAPKRALGVVDSDKAESGTTAAGGGHDL